MSEKGKSDATRFRDILKESDDIMKTAYPPDKDEKTPEEKASINPFTEEKPKKGPLDADFAPDGTVLLEEDPLREKAEKERTKIHERNEKLAAKQNKRRERLLERIKKLEPKLEEAKQKKLEADGSYKYDLFVKKEARLREKLNDLRQRAVSSEQFTPNSGFYIKAHFLRMWVIILIALVSVVVVLSAALICVTYRELTHFKGDSILQRESVNKLNDEVSSLTEEKDNAAEEKATLEQEILSLNEEISTLEAEVTDYKKKNEALSKKADFLEKHILIVNGNLFKKTYHKYGCSKIDYSSFWAYNKEQVEGKLGYSACPDCIK